MADFPGIEFGYADGSDFHGHNVIGVLTATDCEQRDDEILVAVLNLDSRATVEVLAEAWLRRYLYGVDVTDLRIQRAVRSLRETLAEAQAGGTHDSEDAVVGADSEPSTVAPGPDTPEDSDG